MNKDAIIKEFEKINEQIQELVNKNRKNLRNDKITYFLSAAIVFIIMFFMVSSSNKVSNNYLEFRKEIKKINVYHDSINSTQFLSETELEPE